MNRRKFERSRFVPRSLLAIGLLVCVMGSSGCGKGLPGTQLASTLRFTPVGPETGVTFRHDSGLDGTPLPYQQLGAGCAVFDFNNDGWLDLYFVQGAPPSNEDPDPLWNNRLYQGGPGWRFTDVTDRARVTGHSGAGKRYGIGCAVGDWDRDGNEDLLVTTRNGILFYRNEGAGTFRDDSLKSGLPQEGLWTSATFLDFDRDGWLDVYLCRYAPTAEDAGDAAGPAFSAGVADPIKPTRTTSRLYRNVEGRIFRDVTTEAGVLEPTSRSLGVLASDLDGDGWTDLCVTNDGVRNFLFRNDRGVFVERGREAGVAVDESGVARPGRALASAEINGDRLPDLFLTHDRGHSSRLYLSTPEGDFREGSATAGLANAAATPNWGCVFGDFDLDGYQDLFVLGGTSLVPESQNPEPGRAERLQFYHGGPGGTFRSMGDALGSRFREAPNGRGVAAGDLDNDGDLDLVVTHLNASPVLLRNEHRTKNHWFQLRLVGTESNRSGLGARITAIVDGQPRSVEMRAHTGYLCAQAPTVVFGLGAARAVDGLEVRWPSGSVDALPPVVGDRLVLLKEGGDLLPSPLPSTAPQTSAGTRPSN